MKLLGALAAFVALASLWACSASGHRSAAQSGAPASSGSTAFRASAGCGHTPVAAPGTTDVHLESGGVDRVYELDVPPSYDGSKPYAVVLDLHPLSISYKVVGAVSGFTDPPSRYDFIGVAPSGRLDGQIPFWNAAPVPDNYDVDFIDHVLDQVERTLCVDTTRIFSAGMSNGAQMSSLLACRLSDRLAGVGAVAGVEYLAPCDGRPVPILAFHGTADPIVLYGGGGLNATTIANTDFYKGNLPPGLPAPLGVDESMRRWAEHNGCDPAFVEQRVSKEIRHRTWQHCKAATELYIVDGGGHAWPGKPEPQFEAQFGHATTDIDATALMFAFFFGQVR